MSGLTKLINDVNQGIYYLTVQYESEASAKRSLPYRLGMAFLFYYMAVVLLFITACVKQYGPFKPYPLLIPLISVPGLYFVIYRYFIRARILESSFDDSPQERQRKVRVYLLVFGGSIVPFMLTMLAGYFAGKN